MNLQLLKSPVHRRSIALRLCGMLLVTGCVTTYESRLVESSTYPCSELAQAQQQLESMKQEVNEDALRDMRQRISRLRDACSSYQERVQRQIEEFGSSPEEAKEKAAMVVRSTPTEYQTSVDLSPWEIIGTTLGVGLIVGIVYSWIMIDKYGFY